MDMSFVRTEVGSNFPGVVASIIKRQSSFLSFRLAEQCLTRGPDALTSVLFLKSAFIIIIISRLDYIQKFPTGKEKHTFSGGRL